LDAVDRGRILVDDHNLRARGPEGVDQGASELTDADDEHALSQGDPIVLQPTRTRSSGNVYAVALSRRSASAMAAVSGPTRPKSMVTRIKSLPPEESRGVMPIEW